MPGVGVLLPPGSELESSPGDVVASSSASSVRVVVRLGRTVGRRPLIVRRGLVVLWARALLFSPSLDEPLRFFSFGTVPSPLSAARVDSSAVALSEGSACTAGEASPGGRPDASSSVIPAHRPMLARSATAAAAVTTLLRSGCMRLALPAGPLPRRGQLLGTLGRVSRRSPACAAECPRRGTPISPEGLTAGHATGAQELKRCWVFSRPSVMSDSTASAASETWNGSSLRSTVE